LKVGEIQSEMKAEAAQNMSWADFEQFEQDWKDPVLGVFVKIPFG